MKARKPERKVSFDWLGIDVLLITNKKCFETFVAHNSVPPEYELGQAWQDNGRSCMFESGSGDKFFVLFVRKKHMRVIIHECVHMVHQICEAKGIPLTIENSEVIAYMTDFLVAEVIDVINKDFPRNVK